MKPTTPLIVLLSILTLTACSQNPPVNPPKVDRASLIRSMTYIHRHLLAQVLEGSGENRSQPREGRLVQSYCDLIKRRVVHAKRMPAMCLPSVSYEAQVCIAGFHRCIGNCGTFRRDCPVCEQRVTPCLQRVNVEE